MFVNSSKRISIFLKCESCERSLESEKAEKAESFESGSHYVELMSYVRARVIECEREK